MIFGIMFLACTLLTYACLQNPEKFRAAVLLLGTLFFASGVLITLQHPAGTFHLVHQAQGFGFLVSAMLLGILSGLGLYKLSPNALRHENPEEYRGAGENT